MALCVVKLVSSPCILCLVQSWISGHFSTNLQLFLHLMSNTAARRTRLACVPLTFRLSMYTLIEVFTIVQGHA